MPPRKKKFTPSEAIDEDLCYEIFQRLPIKTLCRFRCVCKRFNSLISSPLFIDVHYSFARSATPPHLKPYLHVKAYRGDLIELRFPVPGLYDVVEQSRKPLYFPFRRADREDGIKRVTFVGVIHGVVCFSYNSVSSPPSVILWNPTIHKYVTLPCLRLYTNQRYLLGFGYDTSGKDFKVVSIRVPQWTIKVYSNRQGSWSRPRGFKLDEPWPRADGIQVSWGFNGDVSPCFVNGTIHWGALVIKGNNGGRSDVEFNNSMLMFDCDSEEFRRMSLPAKLRSSEWPMYVKLFEYAGMVAALVDRVIWVMEEHGVATSWKKLYMISSVDGIFIYDPSFERLAPYGPSNTWNMIKGRICDISTEIMSERVYDETMLLMDHSKAQSYTNLQEIDIPSNLR